MDLISTPTYGHTLLTIASDKVNIQLMTQLIARRDDLKLLTAISGRVGMEFAEACQPDVVVMDTTGARRYAQCMQAIRVEYAHVPPAVYQTNRRKALQHLHTKALANQPYADAYFAQLYTQQAVANMAREIATLN